MKNHQCMMLLMSKSDIFVIVFCLIMATLNQIGIWTPKHWGVTGLWILIAIAKLSK